MSRAKFAISQPLLIRAARTLLFAAPLAATATYTLLEIGGHLPQWVDADGLIWLVLGLSTIGAGVALVADWRAAQTGDAAKANERPRSQKRNEDTNGANPNVVVAHRN